MGLSSRRTGYAVYIPGKKDKAVKTGEYRLHVILFWSTGRSLTSAPIQSPATVGALLPRWASL